MNCSAALNLVQFLEDLYVFCKPVIRDHKLGFVGRAFILNFMHVEVYHPETAVICQKYVSDFDF